MHPHSANSSGITSLTCTRSRMTCPAIITPAPTAGPDRVTNSAQVRADVDAALDALSSQERTVFVMRHYHDMPIRDISSSLSLAEGTVKSMLFRSVRKLRDRISQYLS